VAAQALSIYRAGPALSTINRASDRARAVLFRAVPHAANRARPIWNTIPLSMLFELLTDGIFPFTQCFLLHPSQITTTSQITTSRFSFSRYIFLVLCARPHTHIYIYIRK
jgi:hypothetical protein